MAFQRCVKVSMMFGKLDIVPLLFLLQWEWLLHEILKKERNYVIPVIGDGALTGGMALEALNHIGHEKKDMIVILNDNEMSIAPNVGALHQCWDDFGQQENIIGQKMN